MPHHVPAEPPVVDELDGLRHAQPDAAPGHRGGEVGDSHAGGEGRQGAVGAGVRIGADDHVARRHEALLGQQHVLDAHAADLEVVHEAVPAGEVAQYLRLRGRLDVLVGREVVGHEDDLGGVEDALEARLLELGDADRRGDVVGERQVDLGLDDLAGLDRRALAGAGEDLLDDGAAHHSPLPPRRC